MMRRIMQNGAKQEQEEILNQCTQQNRSFQETSLFLLCVDAKVDVALGSANAKSYLSHAPHSANANLTVLNDFDLVA